MNSASGSTNFYTGGSGDTAAAGHGHSPGNFDSGTGGSHQHTLSNTNSASNLPPYKKLLWIRSTQADVVLPINALFFYPSSTAPTGFQKYGSITDGSFIYGATTGDIGGTGGASSHTHTNPDSGSSGAHTHPSASTSSGWNSSNGPDANTFGDATVSARHSHNFSADLTSAGAHTHTIGATGSGSNLPSYVNLALVEYLNGESLPANLIVGFSGSSGSIPSGWALCDGNGTTNLVDKYIRVVTGTTGGIGGTTTHNHTMPNTNTTGSHSNHGVNTSVSSAGGVSAVAGSGWSAASPSHSHGSSAAVYSSGSHAHSNPDTGSSNHEPPYIKLYFIQKT
jgi:hypothetical protein